MKPADVTIVIPAYNEEAAIASVVDGLLEALPDAELLVINDGSVDDTARCARDAGAQVIDHDHNRGYGAALHTGTERAQRDYILFCDSDGQHSVGDVGRLIDACDGHDMVVGERGKDSHVDHTRRPGKLILRLFANHLAGEKIPDLNSGLRILKKSVLLKYLHLMPTGFSFSTTCTFAMLKSGRHIKWVPISVSKRIGTSTVGQLRHGSQTLLLMLRLTVLFEPLRVFLEIATGLAVLSLCSLIIDIVVNRAFNVGDTTVLLGVATLIVFLFGLLCDQISAIRRELHD